MKFKFALLAFVSVTLCTAKDSPQHAELREAAQTIYGLLRAGGTMGLPSSGSFKELTPRLTLGLRSVIAEALAHPSQVPQGDIFSSHLEGVSQWKIGKVETTSNADPMVWVNCTLKEEGKEEKQWEDRLIFRRATGKGSNPRWLLDDIRFGGSRGEESGSLRAYLPGGRFERQSHLSPDEKWKVTIHSEDWDDRKVIAKISIEPADKSAPPSVLYEPQDGPSAFGDGLLWSPRGDRLAILDGTSPRFSSVLVFLLVKGKWLAVSMPELNAKKRAQFDSKGFHERHQRFEPSRWDDSETLVVRDWGLFTKDGAGEEINVEHAIRIGPSGKANVVRTVEMPQE